MNFVHEAKEFAHKAHDAINQKRKYSGEPYWVHLDAVAGIVESVGGTPEMVAAAYLHDYLEDVVTELKRTGNNTLLEEFTLTYNTFPARVRELVVELTDVYVSADYPRLNRKERKRLERERIAKDSADAKTIKLADLINNTESIVKEDPAFARTYLHEKLLLLPLLADGHPALLNHASMQTTAALASLGLPVPNLGA